jgi:hypothetical protein
MSFKICCSRLAADIKYLLQKERDNTGQPASSAPTSEEVLATLRAVLSTCSNNRFASIVSASRGMVVSRS